MVFLPVIAVALAVGLLLGGHPARLARLRIRRSWLFFAALAIQLAAFPTAQLPWSTPDGVARDLWLASYAVLIAAALSNRTLTGVPVMAAGLALNLVAILANGGHMPVLPSALAAEGRSYAVHDNSIALAHPHLAWIVDRWAVPGWIPLGNVFSVGDVLIAAGAALLVVSAMEPRLHRRPAPLRLDAGLLGVGGESGGRRGLLVPAGGSHVLWDCPPLAGTASVEAIARLGGLRAVAISHPHLYADAVQWSRALGGVPVYVHAGGRGWVLRPDPCIELWDGETLDLGDGLTLIRCGGEDAGGQVLRCGETLLAGDIVQVGPDRTAVGFLFGEGDTAAIADVVDALEPFEYDRIVGPWWGLVLPAGARAVVRRSADRQLLAAAA